MRYIDDLIKVSNNEAEFKKELLKIKDNLYSSQNLSRETKLFVNNLNKYCTKNTNEFTEDDIYVLPIDNYCMFILNNVFNFIKNQSEINQKVFIGSSGLGNIPKYFKDKYNEEYINAIINHMDMKFLGNESFQFNNLKDFEYLNKIKIVIKNLNLEIIKDLIGIKPMIFIGENHYIKSSPFTNLGLLTIMLNTYIQPPSLIHLIDNLTRDCMEVLLTQIFEQKDMDYFYKKYSLNNLDNLNQLIGTDLATYIFYGQKSDLIDEVLLIANERNSIEYKIEKNIKSFYDKIEDKLNF